TPPRPRRDVDGRPGPSGPAGGCAPPQRYSCARILPRRANQLTAKPSTRASSTQMFEYAQFPSQYEPAGSSTKVPRPSGSSREPCQLFHGAASVKELTTRPQPSTEATSMVTSEVQSTAP